MILYMLGIFMLYVGANAYLFWRLMQALPAMPTPLRIIIITLFWLAAFAMFLSFGLRSVAMPECIHSVLHVVGTSWLAFLLYMFFATLLADVTHWLWPQFQHGFWYALGITLILLTYGYINYRNPRIEHLSISTDKPVQNGRVRIVAISDVHLGIGTTRGDLSRYVDMINRQKPDIVVVVGDLIDNSIMPVVNDDMCREFRRIKASGGIYMVAGNHEYISGIDECTNYLSTTPIHLCRDSIVEHPFGLNIICRDDRMNSNRRTLSSLVDSADMSRLTITLDHQPNDIPKSSRLGVDLHLSGHTHYGQIWPISLITDAMFKQSHGYRKWGNTHAYVMSGISLWGPPFRIGTHSELLVVDIVNDTKQ